MVVLKIFKMPLYIFKPLVIFFVIVTPFVCKYVSIDFPAASAAGFDSKKSIHRLPNTAIPMNYTIWIKPNYTETSSNFRGVVKITIKVIETKNITLHSSNLVIEFVYIGCLASFKVDRVKEMLIIQPCRKLEINDILNVTIEYTGRTNGTKGLRRISYREPDSNENVYMYITQSKPSYAREIIPCFDEPDKKARMKLFLNKQHRQKSISNTKLERSQSDHLNQTVWDEYATTPLMAPYQLMFAIFQNYTCITNPENTIKACTRASVSEDMSLAMTVSSKAISMMENYTNTSLIAYTGIPVLQLITIPATNFGAMGNSGPGLLLFEEVKMLFNEKVSSEKNRMKVMSSVSHEIARQWWGNWMTPERWGDHWLLEALAAFSTNHMMDQMFSTTTSTQWCMSDWGMRDLFVIEQVHTAKLADLKDSHPITAKVNSPEEIDAIFDNIVYNKGGSVLRMLEHFPTPAAFQAALSTYLDSTYTDSMGTTDPSNFFEPIADTMNSMHITINKDWHDTMNKFKETWFDQAGFPLVTVQRDYNKQTATVSQTQFLLEESSNPSDKRWLIPLTYTTSNEKNFDLSSAKSKMVLVNPMNKTVTIDIEDAKWLIVNIQEIGFYRVNYDPDNWKEIISTLNNNPSDIHRLNRAQLIDDSFNLARAGIISYSVPMTLSKYLVKETDPIPWLAAYPNFMFLLQRYSGKMEREFKKHMANLIKNQYEDLASKSTAEEEKFSLQTISVLACALEVSDCIEEATLLTQKFIQNPEYRIDPIIKGSVLCTGLRYGGELEWNTMWNYYLKSNVAHEKESYLSALACTDNEQILTKFICKLLNSEDQDIPESILFGVSLDRKPQINAFLDACRHMLPAIMNGSMGEESMTKLRNMINLIMNTNMITTKQQLHKIEELISYFENLDDYDYDRERNKPFMNMLNSLYITGLKSCLETQETKPKLMEAMKALTQNKTSETQCPL